jgi:hypothetical protein
MTRRCIFSIHVYKQEDIKKIYYCEGRKELAHTMARLQMIFIL